MIHTLHLGASARGEASHSRQISGEFLQAWLQAAAAYVFGVPMYNLSVPAAFKVCID
jgi:FMN-dependent NADH-azoreductase